MTEDISALLPRSITRSQAVPVVEKSGNIAQDEKAATQFESLLLHQMLGAMWETVPKDELFGESQADSFYRDMFNEALSQSIAEKQSIGIKDEILKDFRRQK